MIGHWLGRYIGHWFGGTQAAPPAQEQQNTGGWLAHNFAAAERQRAKARRRRRELEEEIALLEAHLAEQGVEVPRETPTVDLAPLLEKVRLYGRTELPNRARRAVEYAERARTLKALQLAEQALQRLNEEEEFTVLMLLTVLD